MGDGVGLQVIWFYQGHNAVNAVDHNNLTEWGSLPIAGAFKSEQIFYLSLYFCLTLFLSFLPSSPLSVVWSNNLLIIGCKKYLLRDYARYKELTGDGSQNLSASLKRAGDCRAFSAETEHPLLALHWGLTQLSKRETWPGSAQLGSVLLCLTLVCVINVFTASSSALSLSVIKAWEFCCAAVLLFAPCTAGLPSSVHLLCLVLGNELLTSLELCQLNAVDFFSRF